MIYIKQKNRFIFGAVLAAAILSLSACGFTPLYGKKNAQNGSSFAAQNAAQNYDVSIAIIPNAEGQFLRNLLLDRFYKTGEPSAPRFQLLVSPISEQKQSLSIAKSAESTRAQLRQIAKFELKDLQTGAVMLTREISAISSYNILVSEFATRVAEQNARENGLRDLARQIELQLGFYFNSAAKIK